MSQFAAPSKSCHARNSVKFKQIAAIKEQQPCVKTRSLTQQGTIAEVRVRRDPSLARSTSCHSTSTRSIQASTDRLRMRGLLSMPKMRSISCIRATAKAWGALWQAVSGVLLLIWGRKWSLGLVDCNQSRARKQLQRLIKRNSVWMPRAEELQETRMETESLKRSLAQVTGVLSISSVVDNRVPRVD